MTSDVVPPSAPALRRRSTTSSRTQSRAPWSTDAYGRARLWRSDTENA